MRLMLQLAVTNPTQDVQQPGLKIGKLGRGKQVHTVTKCLELMLGHSRMMTAG